MKEVLELGADLTSLGLEVEALNERAACSLSVSVQISVELIDGVSNSSWR